MPESKKTRVQVEVQPVLDLSSPEVRRLLHLASEALEYEARTLYPHDLYRQSVHVHGHDPLAKVNRALTAERFGGGHE